MTDLPEFLEEQIEIEKKIVEISRKSVEKIDNVLVRELIRGITMDSEKHAMLLRALHGVLTGPAPFIEEGAYDKIADTIQEHINLEREAIETYKKILEENDDKRIQTVIGEIYKDEVRHHNFLVRLQKAIIQEETLTEEELEDWLYKYAPFHGAPG
ncbi:MAG: hypothetical protein GF308_18915 [Candidatus Heimdallarchaeota archaeon]|nr:hypothetical protein [Candidatus Heimdallarchaeota archaeon]